MELKKCSGCKTEKEINQFYKNKARGDGLSPLCVECHNIDTHNRTQRLRQQAVDLLGGRCSSPNCGVPGGMTDIRTLQLDHIYSDGANRRRGLGETKRQGGENGHQIVKAIINGSKDFQVLCANCNWIKKYELGEHVGSRQYVRAIPTERIKGVGKGNAPGQQDGLWSKRWATATEQEIAERNAKISETKRNGGKRGW